MGQRIARHTVGTGLQDDELRRERLEVTHNLLPRRLESGIVSARHQRQIEFRARCLALADFIVRARARVQVAPIFMDVGEDDARVGLETVIQPIAMVSVDVDVGDALQAVLAAQPLDQNAAIVQSAKARCATSRRVVQACDGYEGATDPALHNLRTRQQNASDDV